MFNINKKNYHVLILCNSKKVGLQDNEILNHQIANREDKTVTVYV